jgi:diaminohydroxyphosphoribosylaminopyrimidine deaminase/5-amino-6-(5-phosphoribosylamino)uracil reductase
MTARGDTDLLAMQECFRLAAQGEGFVSPNPLVGAVLVKGGRIVARGFHASWGGPHAEVECLSRYRGSFEGTTLYVNLEPCSHFGKTPPCAELLASTPITRIVVAMADPNPLVSGQGIERLRKSGKRVDVGVLESEARALNRHFITGILKRRPYIHVKVAQSLDGMIAASHGTPRWISGVESRRMVHRWRARYDAVLVGAGTVRADNPRLTARIPGGRHPAAVVIDGQLSVRADARLFRNVHGRRVLVCTTRGALDRKARMVIRLEKNGVEFLPFRTASRIAIAPMLHELYVRDIGSLLVEGGGDVFAQFLRSGLVDEYSIFIAPIVVGDGIPAYTPQRSPARRAGFDNMTTALVGRDILVHWRSTTGA